MADLGQETHLSAHGGFGLDVGGGEFVADAFLFGDVFDQGEPEGGGWSAGGEQCTGDRGPYDGVVAAGVALFDAEGGLIGGEEVGDETGTGGLIIGVGDGDDGAAKELLGGVAEHAAVGGVGLDDLELVVENDDAEG